MNELAQRIDALSELNDAPLPTTFPATEEEKKERYLHLLAEGTPPPEAARQCGETGTWFRRRRNPEGRTYDQDFAERYEEIMRPDGDFEQSIREIAEHALIRAANDGNVRAIEKVLMAYHERYSFLRPAQFQGDTYNVERLVQIMPGIPTHLLEQMREALAEQQMRELPEVIDQ